MSEEQDLAMAYIGDEDYYPVSRITTGAIGDPGRRVFILQAQIDGEPVCWVIEKKQAALLGQTIPRLLAKVQSEFPELGDPLVAARPNLALDEPLEPAFRVASISLDYDRFHDLVVLTLVDADAREDTDGDDEDGADAEDNADVQVFATRGQALLLGRQAEMIISAGRPACPNCGEPIDDFGHFCLPSSTRWKWDSDYLQ
jgi:uncharacterized repeat protein (TIGR03847 family)